MVELWIGSHTALEVLEQTLWEALLSVRRIDNFNCMVIKLKKVNEKTGNSSSLNRPEFCNFDLQHISMLIFIPSPYLALHEAELHQFHSIFKHELSIKLYVVL